MIINNKTKRLCKQSKTIIIIIIITVFSLIILAILS